jgi:hypothetical protein
MHGTHGLPGKDGAPGKDGKKPKIFLVFELASVERV